MFDCSNFSWIKLILSRLSNVVIQQVVFEWRLESLVEIILMVKTRPFFVGNYCVKFFDTCFCVDKYSDYLNIVGVISGIRLIGFFIIAVVYCNDLLIVDVVRYHSEI